MNTTLAGVREAVFASLLVSLVGAGFSTVSAVPAVFFPHSPLLAYFNIFWPFLANTFAFVAAILLTVLISGIFSVAGNIVEVTGARVDQGVSVILIVWLAWVLVSLSVVYWCVIWFVEVRRSSFTRRKRSEEEVGNWKNIGREISSDIKGTKRLLYTASVSYVTPR
jgi:glucan phosphoethanolaminetransferase (alkaline phosphatase superfamily)